MVDLKSSAEILEDRQPCCFLFDFGNVIGLFDVRIAYRRILSLAGLSLDLDVVHQAVHSEDLFCSFERGEINAGAFLGAIQERLGIQVPLEDLARAWSEIMTPNEDVITHLYQLKLAGHRLVLGSNNNELHYRKIRMDFHAVLSLFDAQVFSHHVGAIKPDPAFFDFCVEACACTPGRIVYIDDLEGNIRSGETYGFRAVHYRPGVSLLEQFEQAGIEMDIDLSA